MKRTGVQLIIFLALAFTALTFVGTAAAGWTWDEARTVDSTNGWTWDEAALTQPGS